MARSALLLVGLNVIMFKEGEKVLPVVNEPFCSSLYSLIGTVTMIVLIRLGLYVYACYLSWLMNLEGVVKNSRGNFVV